MKPYAKPGKIKDQSQPTVYIAMITPTASSYQLMDAATLAH